MQKLQAKHDKLFEKIVFAHREDKQDIVKSLCTELAVVRKMINMRKLAYLKLVISIITKIMPEKP